MTTLFIISSIFALVAFIPLLISVHFSNKSDDIYDIMKVMLDAKPSMRYDRVYRYLLYRRHFYLKRWLFFCHGALVLASLSVVCAFALGIVKLCSNI